MCVRSECDLPHSTAFYSAAFSTGRWSAGAIPVRGMRWRVSKERDLCSGCWIFKLWEDLLRTALFQVIPQVLDGMEIWAWAAPFQTVDDHLPNHSLVNLDVCFGSSRWKAFIFRCLTEVCRFRAKQIDVWSSTLVSSDHTTFCHMVWDDLGELGGCVFSWERAYI